MPRSMHSPLSNLQDPTNTKRTMTCVWKDRCHRHHAYHLQALVSGGSATARHWQPELVGSASESAVPGAPVFTATILRKRLVTALTARLMVSRSSPLAITVLRCAIAC